MSYTRTVESRPYDSYFDPVFTTPNNYIQSDPRVAAAASGANAVSGTGRFKYFRRPIMPRISAIPPQILLAPTTSDDPLIPVEEEPEAPTKNAEVQTMYRESEAQTIPYTPDYVLEEGADPEILMLRNLTYENGLPVGQKELEMIENARTKRDLESNMLPFTDEACFHVRKNMMEQQELREYKLREIEVESQRNKRLETLQRTLNERAENIEFLSSQRIEAIRQSRMDIREKSLQKIRKKRINILRKLARKRNTVDPILSTSTSRDIINDYFDRGSDVYAPNRRDGQSNSSESHSRQYEITGRTAPLTLLQNIESLSSSIPRHYTTIQSKAPPSHLGNDATGGGGALGGDALFSKTAPPLMGMANGGRAAMPRLTSAAARNLRNTKKDIETMQMILTKKRTLRNGGEIQIPATATAAAGGGGGSLGGEDRLAKSESLVAPWGTGTGTEGGGSESRELQQSLSNTSGPATARNLLLNRKPKGRPKTPDYTSPAHRQGQQEAESSPLFSAVILLQKLLRGRAIQNSMFEGRYRRRELINELRGVDEYNAAAAAAAAAAEERQQGQGQEQGLEESEWNQKLELVKDSTVEMISGSVTTNLLVLMTQEKEREDYYQQMQSEANLILETRKKRELAEAGRRQREGVENLQIYSVKPPPIDADADALAGEGQEQEAAVSSELRDELSRIMTPVSANFTDLVISSAAEKVAVNEVLNHLDQYPSLLSAFKNAETPEEQEQICRDLVQALSTPRPVSRSQGLFSPESSVNNNEADTIKDELFQSVLSRLRGMQQS